MTSTQAQTGYASVNGLQMYYEIHGSGGHPLVLLHGAFSAIGSSFSTLLPELARTRQVVAFEYQAHGHTADIDRPMRIEQLADDVAAAIEQLAITPADLFGYSLGAGIALHVALRHPEVIRKLVLASVTTKMSGVHPGLMDGFGEMQPAMLYGSPWHEEYLRIAPDPHGFDTLFAKKTEMDKHIPDIPDEAIASLRAPVLLISGDSDIARPEHLVEVFRLLGGGVFGDLAGLPNAQLAVLPGTSHTGMVDRAAMLMPMVVPFLDAPMPDAKGSE
jgi:pimeloyl-ACP methyl ester carboxylesterase